MFVNHQAQSLTSNFILWIKKNIVQKTARESALCFCFGVWRESFSKIVKKKWEMNARHNLLVRNLEWKKKAVLYCTRKRLFKVFSIWARKFNLTIRVGRQRVVFGKWVRAKRVADAEARAARGRSSSILARFFSKWETRLRVRTIRRQRDETADSLFAENAKKRYFEKWKRTRRTRKILLGSMLALKEAEIDFVQRKYFWTWAERQKRRRFLANVLKRFLERKKEKAMRTAIRNLTRYALENKLLRMKSSFSSEKTRKNLLWNCWRKWKQELSYSKRVRAQGDKG